MAAHATTTTGGAAEALRQVLFGGGGGDNGGGGDGGGGDSGGGDGGGGGDGMGAHAPWRRLLTSVPFRPDFTAAPEDGLRTAYARLRLLNDTVGDPLALAADPTALARMHEWLGFVDPTLASVSTIHYNLFLGSLLDQGARTPEELEPYLTLREVGTFLMTEVAHGNDAAAVETTADYDPGTGGFTLHTPCAGAQKFMPNTSPVGGPKTGVVAARLRVEGTDHGVFLFLTPLTSAAGPLPGVRVRALPPRPGSPLDHCLTSFDRVPLPRRALLAGTHSRLTEDGVFTSTIKDQRRRFLTSLQRVMTGKLCMSAVTVGGCRALLTLAFRYAAHRHVSGLTTGSTLPVGALRSHHGPLAEALATTYAMTMLYQEAVRRWSDGGTTSGGGGERAESARLVSVAKAWITWQGRAIAMEVRERCGAQGLLAHNGITGQLSAVEGAITAEGDNQAVMVKAASELLYARGTPHQQDQHNRRDEPSPPPDGELTDPDFLHGLLARAENIWLGRARAALRQAPTEALARRNAAMGPALRAVHLYAHRHAAQALAEPAATPTDARDLLRAVHLLFTLRAVHEHSGDLLRHGHLAERHLDELPLLTERLTTRVAGAAPQLVAAFAVPDEMFAGAPIASADYIAAYDDPEGPWQRKEHPG